MLLGASNLARGLPTALSALRAAFGSAPLDIFVAGGHGRSYGQRSWVLGRSLPGILECELWPTLAARPPAPTYALLTDVGNDVVYGVPEMTIVNWVEGCLQRLARHCARLTLTALPLPSLARQPPWQLELISRLLYPTRQQPVPVLLRRAADLDARLRSLAEAVGAAWIPSDPAWFGLDPIHLHRRRAALAWARFVASWDLPAVPPAAPWLGPVAAWRLRWRAPAQRWFFGIPQQAPQPAATLPGGGALYLY